jgi:excisionase family DNA binding protein
MTCTCSPVRRWARPDGHEAHGPSLPVLRLPRALRVDHHVRPAPPRHVHPRGSALRSALPQPQRDGGPWLAAERRRVLDRSKTQGPDLYLSHRRRDRLRAAAWQRVRANAAHSCSPWRFDAMPSGLDWRGCLNHRRASQARPCRDRRQRHHARARRRTCRLSASWRCTRARGAIPCVSILDTQARARASGLLGLALTAHCGILKRMESHPDTSGRIALSIAEASQLVGLSRRSVCRLISLGKVKSVKVGRRRLVPREELERLLWPETTGAAKVLGRAAPVIEAEIPIPRPAITATADHVDRGRESRPALSTLLAQLKAQRPRSND